MTARDDLIHQLTVLNGALTRLGPGPLVTDAEGAMLPDDNLATVVAATADRVATVARQLGTST